MTKTTVHDNKIYFNLKKRQGRNILNRIKIENNNKNRVNNFTDIYLKCKECNSYNLIHCVDSGSQVCTDCGLVNSDFIGFNKENEEIVSNRNFLYPISRRYERIVHFKQRLSQLTDKDPRLPKEMIIIFENYIKKMDDFDSLNKKQISNELRKNNIRNGYSCQWIQIRRRLGLIPIPPDLDYNIIRNLKMRFLCVENAFNSLFRLERLKENKSKNSLFRKNIININYIILQLIRIEDNNLFYEMIPFLPQLQTPKQMKLNNIRWKTIMNYCKKTYKTCGNEKIGEIFYFEWKYIELKINEINEYKSLSFY